MDYFKGFDIVLNALDNIGQYLRAQLFPAALLLSFSFSFFLSLCLFWWISFLSVSTPLFFSLLSDPSLLFFLIANLMTDLLIHAELYLTPNPRTARFYLPPFPLHPPSSCLSNFLSRFLSLSSNVLPLRLIQRPVTT